MSYELWVIGVEMISKEEIKKKYQALPRKEKEIIGSSLVKVNLGVGLPADLKRVATFLKGSGYIAKAGVLDDVIQHLHDDHGSSDNKGSSHQDQFINKENIGEGLEEYNEDDVTTTKNSPLDIKE